jgi:hypothetical protein
MNHTRELLRLVVYLALKMAQEAAELAIDTQDVAVAPDAVQLAVPAVGREVVGLVVYPPFDMGNTMLEDAALIDMLSTVPPLAPISLNEAFEILKRRLAHLIHSFHDRDRLNRGFVLVEAAEILTWEETGMPSTEHCRTPRWPNSGRERSAPDLIFLAVRRARCTRYRGKIVRIAWK